MKTGPPPIDGWRRTSSSPSLPSRTSGSRIGGRARSIPTPGSAPTGAWPATAGWPTSTGSPASASLRRGSPPTCASTSSTASQRRAPNWRWCGGGRCRSRRSRWPASVSRRRDGRWIVPTTRRGGATSCCARSMRWASDSILELDSPRRQPSSLSSAGVMRKGVTILSDRLMNGEKLERGQSLTSRNAAYTLTLRDDGNLVLAARGQAVWATGNNGQNAERLEVQKDGNCVLYTPDKPVWHTDTKGAKDVRLVLQDDRNVVLYAKDGPAWSSKTETAEPPPPEPEVEAEAPQVAPAAEEAPAPAPAPEPAAAEPAAPPPPPPPPAPRTYTVVSGDTLWAISERFYGDGSKYQVIADASGVSKPDLIHPGQLVTIP